MIEISARENIPILTFDREHVDFLEKQAREMGLNIIQPVYISEVLGGHVAYQEVLVDEAFHILQRILGKKIRAVTFSPND